MYHGSRTRCNLATDSFLRTGFCFLSAPMCWVVVNSENRALPKTTHGHQTDISCAVLGGGAAHDARAGRPRLLPPASSAQSRRVILRAWGARRHSGSDWIVVGGGDGGDSSVARRDHAPYMSTHGRPVRSHPKQHRFRIHCHRGDSSRRRQQHLRVRPAMKRAPLDLYLHGKNFATV